jgi:hypothetical protein
MMELVVDLGTAGVVLHQPDDMARLAVLAMSAHRVDPAGRPSTAAVEALATALAEDDLGRLDPDGTVLIPPDKLRILAMRAASDAGHELPADWEANFKSMIEFAASKGWITSDGAIAAHIEWRQA